MRLKEQVLNAVARGPAAMPDPDWPWCRNADAELTRLADSKVADADI